MKLRRIAVALSMHPFMRYFFLLIEDGRMEASVSLVRIGLTPFRLHTGAW